MHVASQLYTYASCRSVCQRPSRCMYVCLFLFMYINALHKCAWSASYVLCSSGCVCLCALSLTYTHVLQVHIHVMVTYVYSCASSTYTCHGVYVTVTYVYACASSTYTCHGHLRLCMCFKYIYMSW